MIEMEDIKGPISEDIVSKFENEHGVLLPRKYREFLKRYNGGSPFPDCFTGMDDNVKSDVQFFYGLRKEYNYSLNKNISIFSDRIPYTLLAIGCDSGGNQICIGIDGEYIGKVYFWDHEWEADNSVDEVPGFTNIKLISDDFDDFFNGLHE